ncbi:hypothetical protein [Gramella sp. KN1008]|uniref:hypothetical protein n=1 Tax=Gramella sp. KN1008 TaxID=2529298 RepID=UPI001038688C|nr:hypothetical protein [Gramella sp. KN1008]TBW28292.1 hypothetical protein EZJ28_05980 [Gramella sp. KN1008]
MKTKRLITVLIVVGVLLSIPLIAMQFSSDIDWKLLDFIIMGVLLFGTGMAIEFSLRKFSSSTNKLVAIGAILLIFFLIWAELAVGVFGSYFAGS